MSKNKIAVVERCICCPFMEESLVGYYCRKLDGCVDEHDVEGIPGNCPLQAAEAAAERLYLLWLLEEQVLAALGGTISQEDALKECLRLININSGNMTASREEQEYLRAEVEYFDEWQQDLKLKKEHSPVDLDALIERAERYLTPEQDDDYWYYYDEDDDGD